MLFVNRDINGSPLPDGFAAALWNEAAKPIVRLYFDFSGTGVDVEIPPEDVISFSISDKVEGTNGRACANTVSLELHNYYHRYSSHVGNETYDPTIYAYNGPLQADGRGNLRPKRRFRIHVSLPEFPGITVRIFEGIVGTRGFSESIGAGNENTVKVEINDYAKLLLDKKPTGAKVQYGSQWTEKEFCLRNLTISNPGAPTQSLIHQIVAVLDPDFSKIKVAAQNIPISIPYAPLEDNLWSEIATLAEAVHGIAVFTGETLYFGDSRFFGVEESDIIIDNSRFSNLSHYDNTADIKNKLSLSYSQYKKLPMCALWMYPGSDKFGNIPNGGKLFDLTNPDDLPELFDPNVVFKAKYAVNVNTPTVMAGFLAGTPGITVTQEVADNYEVMAADNLGYKMNLSPNITALTRFDITTLRSSAIIHMDKGALTKPILKNLVIYGEPVVKTDENRSFAENASSISQYGELSEEYDNKYITRDVIATSSGSKTHDKAWLDIAMARSSVPRRTYEFSCSMPLLLAKSGTIVTIRESLQGSGVNVKARLDQVSVKYNGVTARWTTSFLAKEEVLLTPVYDYQGQVTPNNGGYAPEPRHIDASEGGVLVPYSVGDTLTYTDGMLYRAVSPKAINEEFSISDFVLVTPSNQDQVILLSKMLSVSTSSITRSRAGELTPASITASGLNSDGTAYAGRIKIALTTNGSTWTTVYTSSADESSKAYTVPATYSNAYVTGVRFSLYAAGGTTKLLREVTVPVALDSSASAIYWGALTTAPTSGYIAGDYYFDDNTSALGGGILRYWTGSAWVEMTSAHPMYAQAIWQALADMGAWATAQDEVIAAASAIFERLVTSNAFIANLFAQQITVPDGGRIRYETGAGVQKRCVQLADEKIDWIDTPDTTPASPEVLRARIGRLGVGGAILMDGEFLAPVEGNTQGGTTFDLNASAFFDSVYEGDSGFRVLYKDATTGYTMDAPLSKAGVLGTPILVRDMPCTDACYVRLPDGRLSIWLATQDTLVNPIYSIGYRVYDSGGGLGAYYVFSSYGSLTEKAGSISALLLSSGQIIVIAASTDTSSGNKYLKALYTDTLWIEGGFNPVSEEIIDYAPSAGFGFNKSGVFERHDGLLQVFYKGNTSAIKSVFSNETIGGALTFGDAFTISGISAGDYGITVESVLGKAVVVFEQWIYGVYQAEISLDGLTAQSISLVFPGETTFRSKPRIHNDNGESYIVHCNTSLLKGYTLSKSRYARIGAGIIESAGNGATSKSQVFGNGFKITVSTSAPSGGADGDLWFKV